LMLDRVKPVRIAGRILEQPIARAKASLECGDAARMLSVDCEHQPVEKAPALRSWPVEERVHGRRQPYNPQMVGEGSDRTDAFTVDAAFARRRRFFSRRRINAGAERRQSQHALDLG